MGQAREVGHAQLSNLVGMDELAQRVFSLLCRSMILYVDLLNK